MRAELFSSLKIPSGTKILLNDNETGASHTVTAGTVGIGLSFAIPAGVTYTSIEVEGVGYIQFTAASTKQVINVRVRDVTALTNEGNPIQVEPNAAVVMVIPFAVSAIFPLPTAGDVLVIAQNAAAADANTTVVLARMGVWGIV